MEKIIQGNPVSSFASLLQTTNSPESSARPLSQAAQLARESRRKEKITIEALTGVLEDLDQPVVVLGADGKFLLWNKKARNILQIDGKEIKPQQWDEYLRCFAPNEAPIKKTDLPLWKSLHSGQDTVLSFWLESPRWKKYIEARGHVLQSDGRVIASVMTWRVRDCEREPEKDTRP